MRTGRVATYCFLIAMLIADVMAKESQVQPGGRIGLKKLGNLLKKKLQRLQRLYTEVDSIRTRLKQKYNAKVIFDANETTLMEQQTNLTDFSSEIGEFLSFLLLTDSSGSSENAFGPPRNHKKKSKTVSALPLAILRQLRKLNKILKQQTIIITPLETATKLAQKKVPVFAPAKNLVNLGPSSTRDNSRIRKKPKHPLQKRRLKNRKDFTEVSGDVRNRKLLKDGDKQAIISKASFIGKTGPKPGDIDSTCQSHHDCKPGFCCHMAQGQNVVATSNNLRQSTCVNHSLLVGVYCSHSCQCNSGLHCFLSSKLGQNLGLEQRLKTATMSPAKSMLAYPPERKSYPLLVDSHLNGRGLCKIAGTDDVYNGEYLNRNNVIFNSSRPSF